MDNIKFREATLTDLPILLKFEQGVVEAERPYNPTLKSGNINYYDIEALIMSDDAKVLVALSGDQLIASSYIKIMEAKSYVNHTYYGYIGFMYVNPKHRGNSISKKMIEELTRWARSRSLTEVRLDVYSKNISAINAYKKSGFEELMVEMRMKI